MRPVNLLPERDRAARPAQGVQGSSYVVLGVLGALLVAVLLFVIAQNQINDRTSKIGIAQQDAQRAETRANQLGAFGAFATTKATRVRSVTDLAKARIDWERFMRELALVLPDRTYLLQADATTGVDASGAATTSTATPAPAGGSTPAAGSPTAHLVGCAASQSRVAVLMVRLRKLHRAQDVTLAESAQEETGTGATTGSADGAAASNTGCRQGKFKFDVTVTFAPTTDSVPEAKDGGKVPATLGGGA